MKHQTRMKYGILIAVFLYSGMLMAASKKKTARPDDMNTPLHLMQAEYTVPYAIPAPEDVSMVLERVLSFLEKATPMSIVNEKSGELVEDWSRIDAFSRLQIGTFRLTSYEWGVTYAGMLLAGNATKNQAFTDYTLERFRFLAGIAPYYRAQLAEGKAIDGQVRPMLQPRALDDCGAMCAAMIKAQALMPETDLRPIINPYMDYIMKQQFRLRDGTLARNRPFYNTVWLDDLFMSLPAMAQMGKLTGDVAYYNEACRQYLLFAEKMFVSEQALFMHSWVESWTQHPAFFWARANGWALMALVEILDVLPENHYQRDVLMRYLRKHIAGIVSLQSKDGLWHQLLDRNDTYLETSASAIYCYALAKSMNRGWIDVGAYGPAALLAWDAIAAKVNNEGQVEGTCVGTGVAYEPAYYAYRPVNVYAAHGYGPVLLAGAEIIRFMQQYYPRKNDSAIQCYTHDVNTNSSIFEENQKRKEVQAGSSRKGNRPVVFTIGDSTVKNGDGSGRNGQWGWGAFLGNYLHADSVTVENHALGGRSSRTFIEEGLFDKVLKGVQAGDYVLIQFGHNDGGDPGKGRCRATLPGNGEESRMHTMETTGKAIDVHTYGWYMRQYIQAVLDKGATPIVCSLIPRNDWKNARVIRHDRTYALWARQASESLSGCCFIDLNALVCDKYDVLGQAFVANLYHGDHTHTSLAGAQLNASIVAEALKSLNIPLSDDVR